MSAELSVVVPSVNGLGDLIGCLEALEAQTDVSLEPIVVDRLGEVVRDAVRRRFPSARVIAVPAGTTIPRMREVAFAAATGDAIAVIEDHVVVPSGWARALLEARRETGAVVGGSIDNAARSSVIDWAAFLCEYSHCITPLPSGPSSALPGNNVVYDRELLARYRNVIAEGKWENNLHDAMHRDGVPMVLRPDIGVGHKKHYTVSEYLSQRFLYARSYAGERVRGMPLTRRLAYGAAAFALPPLLMYRTVARVLAKRRYRVQLALSIPLLVVFIASWTAGEIVGYWMGPADSLSRVC
ncbi:MAG TPA: glycosyltransferase family A protein [Gemmatimonadaceae bacterium]|nr:glycosyltransferase family A protein [Gemmatimonadaceae bacterium]